MGLGATLLGRKRDKQWCSHFQAKSPRFLGMSRPLLRLASLPWYTLHRMKAVVTGTRVSPGGQGASLSTVVLRRCLEDFGKAVLWQSVWGSRSWCMAQKKPSGAYVAMARGGKVISTLDLPYPTLSL